MSKRMIWQEAEDEYMALAAKDDDLIEEDDEDGDQGTTASDIAYGRAIQPVHLDVDREREFEAFFFPKKAKSRTAFDRDHFSPVLRQVVHAVHNINLMIGLCRDVLNNAAFYSQRPAEYKAYVTGLFSSISSRRYDDRQADAAVSLYFQAIKSSSGQFINVLPGKRYSDGVDIVIRSADTLGRNLPQLVKGKRGNSTAIPFYIGDDGYQTVGVNALRERLYPADSPYVYANAFINSERDGNWKSEIGSAIMQSLEQLVDFVPSGRATYKTVPINNDFSRFNKIFSEALRFDIGDFFTDITVDNPVAEQFLQLDLIRLPSDNMVKAKREAHERTMRLTGERGDDAALENEVVASIDPQAARANTFLRASLRFTIEHDIAQFICQAEDGVIKAGPIADWFTMYCVQFLRASSSVKKAADDPLDYSAMAIASIPRFSFGASSLKRIRKARDAAGFVSEKTKANADGLYITSDGTMRCLPTADDFVKSTAAETLEKLKEDYADVLSRNNVSAANFMTYAPNDPEKAFQLGMPQSECDLADSLIAKISSFDGSVIAYDWDYGLTLVAKGGYAQVQESIGDVKPDALTIAEALGYNMAKEGETPVQQKFSTALYSLSSNMNPANLVAFGAYYYGHDSYSGNLYTKKGVFSDIINLYLWMNHIGKAASPSVLVERALAETPLSDDDSSPNYATFYNHVDGKGAITETGKRDPFGLIEHSLTVAVQQASGEIGSWLYRQAVDVLGPHPQRSVLDDFYSESPYYFESTKSTMRNFTNVYKFFGGQLFYQVLKELTRIPVADFAALTAQTEEAPLDAKDGAGNQYKFKYQTKASGHVLEKVLPIGMFLGKYVPNADQIFAEADEVVKSIRPDVGLDSTDIHVPGLLNDESQPRSIFPHQLSAQSYLRKGTNAPAFAILSVAPGGGKTGQGIIDFACLAKDFQEVGTPVKPLVICPPGLINTWVTDVQYFMGNNWNVIPLSSSVMKANRWKPDDLLKLCLDAPPNTVFVTSYQFLRGRRRTFGVGSVTVQSFTNLELIKRIGTNYIAIDESHNLKNINTSQHNSVKRLTTGTQVRWLRLLSGTIMPDRAKDIEGQVALYNPAIYRSGEIANISATDKDVDISTVEVKLPSGTLSQVTFTPLNGRRAQEKLSRYCAFISKKRRDWAYMLPAPINTVYYPTLVGDNKEEPGYSEEQHELELLHDQLYQTTLTRVEEDMQKLIGDMQRIENEAAKKEGREPVEVELDDTMLDGIFADFERMIIDPQGDESFQQVFGDKGKDFIPRKVKQVLKLVERHFNTPAWQAGGINHFTTDGKPRPYREYDLVSEDGQLYVLRKFDTQNADFQSIPHNIIDIPPSKNPDYWKPEPEGKLIIITRYNRSGNAIYRALSSLRGANYQAMAVKYNGDEPDKKKAFQDFKTNPKIKILIANEQGMSEGHNLQMASRIIRAECPWGPGALDQTSARIFRPDPKGAKGGELARDVIYLDWVIVNNTVEVSKIGKVISKLFNIAQFTEAGDSDYERVFQQYTIPEDKANVLKLNRKTLALRPSFKDEPFVDVMSCWAALTACERKKFLDMRVSNSITMLPLTPAPNLDGSAKMEVTPWEDNQPYYDERDWKTISLEQYAGFKPEILDDLSTLIGTPVATELGTGIIIRAKYRKGARTKVGRITVKIKNPPAGFPQIYTADPTLIQVCTGSISAADYKRMFDSEIPKDIKVSKEEEELEKRLAEQERQEEIDAKIRAAQERKNVNIVKARDKDAKIRQDNRANNRPENEGIAVVQTTATAPTSSPVRVRGKVATVQDVDLSMDVFPAYYHGFATLEADFSSPDIDLTRFGFVHTPDFAFVSIANKKKFHDIYAFLDDTFDLSDKTVDIISAINRAFPAGKVNTQKLWYNIELAPVSELPSFFSIKKRTVKNPNEVRVYPVFTPDAVMLCVDIRTNPAIVPYLNKRIPGAGVAFKRSPGRWFYFGRNKTDLKNMVTKLSKEGFIINNKGVALKEITSLTFHFKTK